MQAGSEEPPKDWTQVVADEILAQRSADGDTAAFEVLVRRHGPLMRAYVARITGSHTEADDVVQEAFYTAWRRLPELRDPAAVKPWLMRIASRLAHTQIRKRPPEQGMPISELPMPSEAQPENVAVRNAQLHALSVALDALPADQRQCWILREVAELSYDEIAEDLGLPTATVRGKLARARAGIYARMEGWR